MNFVGRRIQVDARQCATLTYELDPRANALYKPVPGKEPRTEQAEKLRRNSRPPSTGSIFLLWALRGRLQDADHVAAIQVKPRFRHQRRFDRSEPDLKPEFARSYEIGLRGKLNNRFFVQRGQHLLQQLHPVLRRTAKHDGAGCHRHHLPEPTRSISEAWSSPASGDSTKSGASASPRAGRRARRRPIRRRRSPPSTAARL